MTTVADVMIRELHTIAPTVSIQDAAHKMNQHNVGSLPVTQSSRLVGTITDRDITVRVIAEGRDPHVTLVRDAMTIPPVVVRPKQYLVEAEALMMLHQVRRLPVVESSGRLVGYITLATVAREEADENVVGRVLKGIFQPRARTTATLTRKAPERTGGKEARPPQRPG